jgi:hypothetical protein
MGIRLNSSVVYGVKFSKKETMAFENFMENKPEYWFLMRFIEQQLKQDWIIKKSGKPREYDCFFAHYFTKISPKTKTALHPYKPFWAGMSKKDLAHVEKYLFSSASDYMKSMDREDLCGNLDRDFILWPALDNDGETTNLFGYIQERNYAREVDYALINILKLDGREKSIVVKGNYPWELGTSYGKMSKQWMTCNGQHMIPLNKIPAKDRDRVYAEICTQKGGTKEQFIAKKKAIWDKYHGTRKPYKTYYGEGWFGSDFYFYSMDELFKLISKHIPSIKYDVMRLEKFLCFYWS